MIVDCAIYKDGQRIPGDAEVAGSLDDAGEDGFVWVGLHKPTVGEFELVRNEFSLHELVVEDAVVAHQKPKLEVYDDSIIVVLKPARYVDSDEVIELGEITIILGKRFVVVVRHGHTQTLVRVRRNLENRPDILAHGPSSVLHAVMDHVVDGYAPAVDGVANDIDEVEREVFFAEWRNPVERIYFLKREVLSFRQAVSFIIEPLTRLSRGTVPFVHEDMREYFRDVYDHAVRVASQVDQTRDLLTSILEANLTQIGVRQNEDMRKISAWVAVGVVPTLLAGIYGMNFSQIPLLHSGIGFPAIVALMVLVAAGLYRSFRKSGWL